MDKTEDIEFKEFNKKTPEKKFKSHLIIIILILLVIGLIFLAGKMGENFFGFFIFIVLFSIPIFILFEKKIKNLLPDNVSDLILDDKKEKENIRLEFEVSTFMKEVAIYLSIIIFCGGALYLLILVFKNLKTPLDYEKSFDGKGSLLPEANKQSKSNLIKILGAVVCLCISGVSIVQKT